MLRQIVRMSNCIFENLDSDLENNKKNNMNFNERLEVKVNILLQQLLEQKFSRLTFNDMKDLSLLKNQKKHIKNLFKHFSSVRFEIKFKAMLQSVTSVKMKFKRSADSDVTLSNNKSDRQTVLRTSI